MASDKTYRVEHSTEQYINTNITKLQLDGESFDSLSQKISVAHAACLQRWYKKPEQCLIEVTCVAGKPPISLIVSDRCVITGMLRDYIRETEFNNNTVILATHMARRWLLRLCFHRVPGNTQKNTVVKKRRRMKKNESGVWLVSETRISIDTLTKCNQMS